MMRRVSIPWLNAITCIGQLAVGLLVLARGRKSALRWPLACLCFDVFLWSFGALAYRSSGREAWHGLDDALSPLAMPLMVHVVLVFVGQARRFRVALITMYACFVAMGVSTAWSFAVTGHLQSWWSTVFLTSEVVLVPTAFALLLRHLWASRDPLERVRTHLVLSALTVAVLFGLTDFADVAGLSGIPQLSHVGSLLSAILLATVSLRFRLLGEEPSTSAAVVSLVAGALTVLAYLAVFRLLPLGDALLVLVLATLGFALMLAARGFSAARAAEVERMRELSTLGRFSAQMAHDLKNPLAALRGAIQFLQEERVQGRSIDEQESFLPVMLEQVSRLQRVIDRYQRISRIEPQPVTTDVGSVVREVLALQSFAARTEVTLEAQIEERVEADVDRDLLAVALENLVRNALEASSDGGRIVVRARSRGGDAVVEVEDEGTGIDPRDRERIFEDFFTTKTDGSGLGLAYVRRIARAHGGEASLETPARGKGTLVAMRFPTHEGARFPTHARARSGVR